MACLLQKTSLFDDQLGVYHIAPEISSQIYRGWAAGIAGCRHDHRDESAIDPVAQVSDIAARASRLDGSGCQTLHLESAQYTGL